MRWRWPARERKKNMDERIMKALEMKDGTQAALIEAVKAEIGMDAE